MNWSFLEKVNLKKLVGVFLTLMIFPALVSKSDSRSIWVAEIRGTINPATANYLEETLKHAESSSAELLLIELDTPGGLVASVRSMAQAIGKAQVPVVVYVTPAGASATSAGALLMLASHVAAMAPGTNIGAAHPVGAKGEDVKGAMGEKILEDTAAFARGLAELRGRNREVAQKIVEKSKSYTAKEAQQEKFIEIIAQDRVSLLKELDGRKVKMGQSERTIRTEGVAFHQTEMTLSQKLLNYLSNPNVSAILMTLGMLLLYVEITNPGITIAGVLGGICLLIAFMAFQVLPIQVGGVALLFLGMVLMIAEAFVSAKGALAAGGVLSFILGLIWFVDPEKTDVHLSQGVIVTASLVVSSTVFAIAYGAARTSKLARETLQKMGGGHVAGLEGYHGMVEAVKEGGLSGKAVFRGEVWEFESSEPVVKGDTVMAEKLAGFHVKVKKV